MYMIISNSLSLYIYIYTFINTASIDAGASPRRKSLIALCLQNPRACPHDMCLCRFP